MCVVVLDEVRGQRCESSLCLPIFLVCLFEFVETVTLQSPGCPGTHLVEQPGLELPFYL